MKTRSLLGCTALVWLAALPGSLAYAHHEDEHDLAACVATVNGVPIASEDFANALRREQARLRAFAPREDPDVEAEITARAARQTLLALVQEQLIRAEAQRRGLRVSAFEVAAGLAREQRRCASEAEFEDSLLRHGITREALERSLELGLLENRLKRDIGSDDPTPAEARAYYDEHADQFVEELVGGAKRRLPFEEVADSIQRRLRARRLNFGYLDWLRQALAEAEVAINTPQVWEVVGSHVRLTWPVDPAPEAGSATP